MEIAGEQVRLRLATPDDVAAVLEILQSPSVAQWWPNATAEDLAADLEGESLHCFVIEAGGDPIGTAIGFIQYAEQLDPEYRHASIDVVLGERAQGHGLGTDAVRALVRHLTRELGHHRVTIDPAAANTRAIRCYEKVGFRPVGVMRNYERGGDGTWHDGLLMDLLAEDLT